MELSSTLRSGVECDLLKGRLAFDPDHLTPRDLTDIALNEAARARCEHNRAEGLVGAWDAQNSAWREYANDRRR